jgi:hypothetical protein
MSKLAIAIVLSALFVVCGQTAITNATAQSQLLTVKDPAEYDAYIKVVQTTAPTERVQVAERFLWQYPHTVVKAEVLKLLLLAYQQLKNEDEVVRSRRSSSAVGEILKIPDMVSRAPAGALHTRCALRRETYHSSSCRRKSRLIGRKKQANSVSESCSETRSREIAREFTHFCALCRENGY